MSVEWFTIGILLFLLGAQQGFWMFHHNKLLNKLMSRNYQDYAQGERLRVPRNVSKTPPSSAVFDPITEDNAAKANKFFAI